MPETFRDVTDAELAVLQALWDRGPLTRGQVRDILYPGGNAVHYGTVQKLLERLEAKACVRRRRVSTGLIFTPTVSRDELIHRRLLDVAEKLCGGALTPLMMNLVRAKPLSATELDELRVLVEDMRRQARGKHR
jgi:predicted transcriptional regulator